MIPRRDPLNGFEEFHGGFNVVDKHYWSSTIYLGIWGYCLAVICLLFGVTALAWHFCQCIRSRKRWKDGRAAHSDELSHCKLIFVLQVTVIALISTALIFWGNNSVHKELSETSRMLVTTSNDVLHQVEGALLTLESATFPVEDPSVVDQIQAGCDRLNSTAKGFSQKLEFAKTKVHMGLKIMNLIMKLTGSLMMCAVLIGLVSAIGNHKGLLILLFAMVTVLLFASWIFSGLSFVLYSLTNDACQAMRDYDSNQKDSTLSKLLPCLQPEEATVQLNGARDSIKTLLSQANRIIGLANVQEDIILLNQKTPATNIPVMPFICDPYGPPPGYVHTVCEQGTCPVQNFSTIFAPFHCKNDSLTYCFVNKTPVPNQIFLDVAQAMNATSDIIVVLPKLHSIMTCNFVTVAFEELTMQHCDPLKTGSSALWVGFAVASMAMLALQVMWLIICRTKLSLGSKLDRFDMYKGRPYVSYT